MKRHRFEIDRDGVTVWKGTGEVTEVLRRAQAIAARTRGGVVNVFQGQTLIAQFE